jgi:hypothetical protein
MEYDVQRSIRVVRVHEDYAQWRVVFVRAARSVLSLQACSLHSGCSIADESLTIFAAQGESVREKATSNLKAFIIELVVYTVLVIAYVLLVLGLLGDWLKHLYDNGKTRYAFAALLLIIGQGVVLEMVTSLLLRLIKPRNE